MFLKHCYSPTTDRIASTPFSVAPLSSDVYGEKINEIGSHKN